MIEEHIERILLNPPFSKGDTTTSPFNKGRLRGISKVSFYAYAPIMGEEESESEVTDKWGGIKKEGLREAEPPFHILPPLLCSYEGEGD
jgi:hypothetical protein